MVDIAGSNGHLQGATSRRRTVEVLDGLIAAGVRLAREGGPDAVILREATRNVGVSPNAAYRHFADREDLLSAVAWEATGMLAARMQRDLDAVPGRVGTMKWARARLRAVGLAYLGFARDEPGLFRTAFAARGGPHAARAYSDTSLADARSPLQILDDTLDDLVTAGALPRARRAQATASAWAAVHGLANLRLAGALPGDPVDALDDSLDQFIQRGL
jgi:AcrR family transcriptional regulator